MSASNAGGQGGTGSATAPQQRTRQGARGKRRLHPLAITAIVIFITVFITYYAFNQGLPFVHRYTLYTLVNNSVNVRSGDPVRIAGIAVGSVEGTSPAGNETKIAFSVSGNGLPIHRDATVRIRPRLFLEGSYYLQLEPGSPTAPTLHDGDTIPQTHTSTPVQFYKVLSLFDVATRSNVTNLLETLNRGFDSSPGRPLSQSGTAGLKSAIPALTPTVKDVAWISRALQGTHPGDVQTLLTSSSQVVGTLAQSSTQLADLVTGLNRTSSALAASDGALGHSISGLDQTLRIAPASLSAVDHALPPLTKLAFALDPSLKAAPPILDQMIGTVHELGAVVAPSERRGLLTTLKATFEQFPVILSQLAKAFPITKQVTDCLQSHVVPILNSEVPDGSLSTGRPVWQDFVHFLPGLAGASGGFDANGPYTRVLAGGGTNTLSGSSGLVGTIPGGSSLQGARPTWAGDLTPSDFRPDVPCATQPVPSLAASTAPPDLQPSSSSPFPLLTLRQLKAAMAKAGSSHPATRGSGR